MKKIKIVKLKETKLSKCQMCGNKKMLYAIFYPQYTLYGVIFCKECYLEIQKQMNKLGVTNEKNNKTRNDW